MSNNSQDNQLEVEIYYDAYPKPKLVTLLKTDTDISFKSSNTRKEPATTAITINDINSPKIININDINSPKIINMNDNDNDNDNDNSSSSSNNNNNNSSSNTIVTRNMHRTSSWLPSKSVDLRSRTRTQRPSRSPWCTANP